MTGAGTGPAAGPSTGPGTGPAAKQLQEVRAELPGSVVAVSAAVGDRLTTTDPVVVLDSMKMEIPVAPEHAGTVVEIAVAVGDTVREGDLIARLS